MWLSKKSDRAESVMALDRIPNRSYNFKHTIVQEAPACSAVVLWNLTDFGHVHWMHRKTYHHCKILARKGRLNLVEFGVNQFFFLKLPIYFNYLMWHEVVSADFVRHVSRNPWGGYTKGEVRLEEFLKDGKKHTRLHHSFYMSLPKWMMPLKFLLEKYMEMWSGILWKEDYSMLVRRQLVLDMGFKDYAGAVETEVNSQEGIFGVFSEPSRVVFQTNPQPKVIFLKT